MKRVKLFEQFINELKFNDVEDFKAYASKHKVRATTVVTVGGKEMKAGEVGKKEDKEESSNPKGIVAYAMKDPWDDSKMDLTIKYKKDYYTFSEDQGWTEAFMMDSGIERLQGNEKPFAAVLKAGEKMLPDSAAKFLERIGLKKPDPEQEKRNATIEKKVERYDEQKKYSEIKIDKVNKEAFEQLEKDKDTSEFLAYLIHDKSHVTSNAEEVPEMTKIFKMTKDAEYKGNLYRGMYDASPNDFKVGEVKKFGRYQSFSETDGVARQFAGTKENEGVVLSVKNPKGGFNYGGWIQDNIDPKEDQNEEINFARFEREHIFDRNQKYKVVEVVKDGPFTIVNIEFID